MRSRHVAGGLALTVAAFGLGVVSALPSQAADAPSTRLFLHSASGSYATDARGTVPFTAPPGSTLSAEPPARDTSATAQFRGALIVPGSPNTPTWSSPLEGTINNVCLDLFLQSTTISTGPPPAVGGSIFANTRFYTPNGGPNGPAMINDNFEFKEYKGGIARVTGLVTRMAGKYDVAKNAPFTITSFAVNNPDYTIHYDSAMHFSSITPNSSAAACTADKLKAPAGGAKPPAASAAPSASASAAPSSSASAAPSASASASTAPSATPTGGPAEPTGSTSPSAAPRPTPTRTSTTKTNPGCGPAPAGSSSTTPSPAPSSEQRTPTTLSLSSNATRIRACNTPLLSGIAQDLQGRVVRGAEITISAKAINASAYTDVATVVTDESGRYTLQVRPLVTTSYLATAKDSAESPAMSIDVATRVVISSPRADSATGRTVTLRGHLVPGHASAPVVLGYVRGGRFVELSRGATDSKGFFRLSGEAPAGRYTFRVATPARRTNLAGQETVTLTVQ